MENRLGALIVRESCVPLWTGIGISLFCCGAALLCLYLLLPPSLARRVHTRTQLKFSVSLPRPAQIVGEVSSFALCFQHPTIGRLVNCTSFQTVSMHVGFTANCSSIFFWSKLNRNLIATKSAFSFVRKSKIELHACG